MDEALTRDRTPQQSAWRLAAVLAVAFAIGCGGSGGEANRTAGSTGGTAGAGGLNGDGGAPAFDAGGGGGAGGLEGGPEVPEAGLEGFFNNPVAELAASPDRNPWLATDAQDPEAYVTAAVDCYSTPRACGTTECEAFASCCVATGSCCQPTGGDSFDFAQCAGLPLGGCAPAGDLEGDVFGAEPPILTNGGLVPNGTATSEGGVLVGDAVNLASERVRVDVRFTLPVGCGGTCLQSAGVAFTPQSEADGFSGAAVGLLLSGSQNVVSLIIGGQVADSFDAGSNNTTWTLTVSPDRTVAVARNGTPQAAYPFDSAAIGPTRLAVFGRNLGADDESAAVASLSIETELCDNPQGWLERAPILVSREGVPDPKLMMGREPSIASGPQTSVVAFEADGQIFVGNEVVFAQVDVSPGAPVIFPTEPFEAGGVGEPELFWLDGTLRVFYTAYDQSGAGTIASAELIDGVAEKDSQPVLAPDLEVSSFESPTVVSRDGLMILVVRATMHSGASELRAYYTPDLPSGWARVQDGALEALTRVDDPTTEIGSPSLVIHNGAYQLYYARRIGTGWAVELAVSDELLIWRPLGEVLGPGRDGFDSMGARGPDARSLGDAIELVYMGQDGVSFRLGVAARPAPSDTAFSF